MPIRGPLAETRDDQRHPLKNLGLTLVQQLPTHGMVVDPVQMRKLQSQRVGQSGCFVHVHGVYAEGVPTDIRGGKLLRVDEDQVADAGLSQTVRHLRSQGPTSQD